MLALQRHRRLSIKKTLLVVFVIIGPRAKTPSLLSFFFPFSFFSPSPLSFHFFYFLHTRARVGCSQDVVRSAPDVGRGEEKFLPGNERRIRGDFAGIKLRSEGRRSKVSLTGQAFVAGKFPCLGLNRIVVEKCLQEITATNVAPWKGQAWNQFFWPTCPLSLVRYEISNQVDFLPSIFLNCVKW